MLTHLKVLSCPGYKKWVLECHLLGFIYLCAPHKCPISWIFFLYSALKRLSVIGLCLVNMHVLAPKIEVCQMGPKKQRPVFALILSFSDTIYVLFESADGKSVLFSYLP